MSETDLSEGFGFKPGCLSEIKNNDEIFVNTLEEGGNFSYSHETPNSKMTYSFEEDFHTLSKILKSKYDAIKILQRISYNINVEKMSLEKHLLEITLVFKNY